MLCMYPDFLILTRKYLVLETLGHISAVTAFFFFFFFMNVIDFRKSLQKVSSLILLGIWGILKMI